MKPLNHDSAVSMALLSQNSAVSLTPLSQNLAVPWVPLSQRKLNLAPRLSGVIDTAKPNSSDANGTAESKLSCIIDTAESAKTPRNQF